VIDENAMAQSRDEVRTDLINRTEYLEGNGKEMIFAGDYYTARPSKKMIMMMMMMMMMMIHFLFVVVILNNCSLFDEFHNSFIHLI